MFVRTNLLFRFICAMHIGLMIKRCYCCFLLKYFEKRIVGIESNDRNEIRNEVFFIMETELPNESSSSVTKKINTFATCLYFLMTYGESIDGNA